MIGVFDSGYGGLTVLKPFLQRLPEYDYLYLGDNARTPYGSRGEDTVKKYSEEAIEYLHDQGAKLIITACNTVSALALRHLQQKYPDRKILGVLIPLAEEAVKATKNKKVCVAGTRGTIDSKHYDEEILKLDKEVKVFSQACPLIVPLIEEHYYTRPEAKKILKKYLTPLKSKNADTMILGCTHYPLMYKEFCNYMGKNVKVLKSGEIIAEKLEDYLKRHPEIEKKLTRKGSVEYLTTDCPQRFKEFANRELNLNVKKVKQVQLW